MRRMWLWIPAFAMALLFLGGCSVFQGGIESVPTYVDLGASVLENELRADLATLSNEELQERSQIMGVINPSIERIQALGVAYEADIDAEIARRQP